MPILSTMKNNRVAIVRIAFCLMMVTDEHTFGALGKRGAILFKIFSRVAKANNRAKVHISAIWC